MELVLKENIQRLEYLEGIIEKGLYSFYEVGKALLGIRDNQLYDKVKSIANFETYCKERWGFKQDYARKLIRSTGVIDNIKMYTIVLVMPQTGKKECLSRPPATTRKTQQGGYGSPLSEAPVHYSP